MSSSRRKTLGGISNNRRVSLAADVDLAKPTSSRRKQRMSMMPRVNSSSAAATPSRHNDRRISLGPAHNKQKDVRPITERAYQLKCIHVLHNYLTVSKYEEYAHPISKKDLHNPSKKDFQSILTFLLQNIDATFMNGNKKFDEEVLYAFRVLGYPYNISKTALAAAGSKHTWPTLLVASTWLVELLEPQCWLPFAFDEKNASISCVAGEAGVPFENAQVLEKRSELAFLKYVEISYNSFLSGDDELLEEQEVELLQYFENDNIMIEREIEEVMRVNEEKAREIELIGSEGGDLPERQQNLEDLASDSEKLDRIIEQFVQHKATLEQKVHDYSAHLKSHKDEIEKKEAKLEHLQSIIQNQEYSKDDIHKLENDKANLQEKIRQTRQWKESNETTTLEKAMELKTLLDGLYNIVNEFNEQVEQTFPEKDHEDVGSPTLISVQIECAHQDQSTLFGGVDLKNTLLPEWRKQKDDLREKISALRRDLFDLQDAKEQSEDLVADKKSDVDAIVPTKRRAVDGMEKEKEEQDQVLLKKESDLDMLQKTVESLKDEDSFQRSISELKQKKQELEASRNEQQSRNNALKEQVLKEFHEFLQYYAELKLYEEEALRDLKEFSENQQEYLPILTKEEQNLLETM